ncbi:AzlD domain-containing protein [Streptococcus hyointestinalis]|uniref:Branched-chain amino acid transport protein azlD n=1 Tax=Streptococcus hyointestinalis TaxID=1337 RepID=A0A380KEG0_9STRE|nr:AzlD domain-containing protein [Streptococcus hyointestinalis]MCI6872351.1 AzlD domain-containing protein [Streptococcus hyointestinalis]MDD6383792.1 AzlD domain-containing protein [Streptococcus hyointestinalis]MDD7356599.1 AzlD domain-containing protein [Streptococcus hyointestinalis]MDY4553615.1 AzlD domain-containing protein [Streptococcus hyointestinalis]SUN63482.1 Branched-chain amino acid transport protein azlD [Streptococcus hyointestinalis]
MSVSSKVLVVILLSAVVTWLPRVAPFLLTKYQKLPDSVIRFLDYLPISIIFALLLSSVMTEKVGQLPSLDILTFLAIIPTLWVAIRYKNILLSVLVGVLAMALLRLIG